MRLPPGTAPHHDVAQPQDGDSINSMSQDISDDVAPEEPQPESSKRVSELVAEELLRAIREKRLADDRRRLPSERNLAELLKVSRTSVRHALQHLQALGIVELGNKSRAQVVDFESNAFRESLSHAVGTLLANQQFADFQEARAVFEAGTARYAANHASPEQIGQLTEALMENQNAIGNHDRFVETDMQFHRVLAAMSGGK